MHIIILISWGRVIPLISELVESADYHPSSIEECICDHCCRPVKLRWSPVALRSHHLACVPIHHCNYPPLIYIYIYIYIYICVYMYISMMTFLCNRIDFHLIVVISCNFHLRIVAMLIPVRWPSHSMKNHLQKGVYAMFMYIHIYIYIVCAISNIYKIYIYNYLSCVYIYIHI